MKTARCFSTLGHTAQFKIYQVEDGQVTSAQVVETEGSGHGALAGFLRAQGVDTLICGGIGGGAKTALAQAGIQLYGGVSGTADKRWRTCWPAGWCICPTCCATITGRATVRAIPAESMAAGTMAAEKPAEVKKAAGFFQQLFL